MMKSAAWALCLQILVIVASAIHIPSEELEADHYRKHLRRLQTAAAKTELPAKPTPDSHRITSLPLLDKIPEDMELFSGLLSAAPDGHKQLFYWLVAPTDEHARQSHETPVIIWLNGGPGCSSMEGFFIEHGPLQFFMEQGKWKIVANPNSWHLAPAWVVYIDQPVGTGLSYTTKGDYARNDDEVNQDFFYFLEEFFLVYQQHMLDKPSNGGKPRNRRPVYFAGESHAGHYIPSMMDYIIQRQEDSSNRVQLSLSGAAIGNGWIDPFHQYAAAEVAYGLGFISLSQKAHLDAKEGECQKQLEAGDLTPKVCFSLLDDIVKQSHGSGSSTHPSRYDATKWERKGQERVFPEGHKIIESYLGGAAPPRDGEWNVRYEDVLDSLHATDSIEAKQMYRGCSDPPYYALAHQDGLGVVPQIANILEKRVRLLFYNGMKDLICNHVGNEIALMHLPWSQAEQWRLAPRYTWHVHEDGPPAAYVQEKDNLIFLKIPDSGHMLPQDKPELSLAMIRRFVYQISFKDSRQDLEGAVLTDTAC